MDHPFNIKTLSPNSVSIHHQTEVVSNYEESKSQSIVENKYNMGTYEDEEGLDSEISFQNYEQRQNSKRLQN